MKQLIKYKRGKKVLIFTFVINTILAVLKITIGYFYHSKAIIADGIHSASDSLSSIIVMVSLKLASKPPDKSHPYGHERSETLATIILAISLIISGVVIIKNNVMGIFKSNFYYPLSINIWVAVISIILQEITYHYAINIGKIIDSQAIIADAKHHRSDALSSVAALIGIIGTRHGYPYLDPLAGIIVAGMIIRIGIKILIPVINEIMEKSPEDNYLLQIKQVVLNNEEIKELEAVKIRKHSSSEIIEMTIFVNPGLKVEQTNKIVKNIEENLKTNLSNHHIKEVIIQFKPLDR